MVHVLVQKQQQLLVLLLLLMPLLLLLLRHRRRRTTPQWPAFLPTPVRVSLRQFSLDCRPAAAVRPTAASSSSASPVSLLFNQSVIDLAPQTQTAVAWIQRAISAASYKGSCLHRFRCHSNATERSAGPPAGRIHRFPA